MISHDNITWTTTVLLGMFPFDSTERCVSYLPLSHIAAQVLDMHGPMSLGCSVYFAQPDALRGSLVVTLKAVRPTMFFGVPRVWEKIYEKMSEVGKSTKGAKKSIATWAKRKGTERSQLMQYGAKGGYPSWFWLANMAVFSKVKASLGLDATKCCFTAAAPISREVLEYFASLNIPIYEVFGQSECTGPHTVNTPSAWKVGTVGRPMLGTESKIDPESGELCYRGRHIFMGYLKGPEASAETIDEEGWLHSGDVVTSDADENPHIVGISGFFSITGRIKELIITAGGENVPPVLIEEAFKKELPYISNCMVIGDQRKFLSIVIALKVEIDVTTGVASNKLTGSSLDHSESIGSSARTAPEAGACPKWKAILDAGMKKVNERSTSRAQVVQKWCIIPSDFTEAGGELTPTLKLKRKPTAVKYADLIDAMYK
jgi:long-chain-fatty-acid--CoA ligase ACSBG